MLFRLWGLTGRSPCSLACWQTHLLRRGDRKGQSILSSITPQVMVRRRLPLPTRVGRAHACCACPWEASLSVRAQPLLRPCVPSQQERDKLAAQSHAVSAHALRPKGQVHRKRLSTHASAGLFVFAASKRCILVLCSGTLPGNSQAPSSDRQPPPGRVHPYVERKQGPSFESHLMFPLCALCVSSSCPLLPRRKSFAQRSTRTRPYSRLEPFLLPRA